MLNSTSLLHILGLKVRCGTPRTLRHLAEIYDCVRGILPVLSTRKLRKWNWQNGDEIWQSYQLLSIDDLAVFSKAIFETSDSYKRSNRAGNKTECALPPWNPKSGRGWAD